MNEEMAEPVYRAVSTYWERVFVGSLQQLLQRIVADTTRVIRCGLSTLHVCC